MDFIYQDPYPIVKDDTQYKKLSSDFVKVEQFGDREILTVDPKGLELLAQEAMNDVSFMLRTAHLQKLQNILNDPEATDNDRFVAYNLLQNASVAVEGQLPSCQDTGTAIVMAKKERMFTQELMMPNGYRKEFSIHFKIKIFGIHKLFRFLCLKKKIQVPIFRHKLIFMLRKELLMSFCF